MKTIVLLFTIITTLIFQVMAQANVKQSNKNASDINRVERAKEKYKELFAADITASKTDPELLTILQRMIFGEVFYIGNLDDKTRELITITVLTTNQTLPQLQSHTNAALN